MHNAFLGVKPAKIEWRQYNSEKHQWLDASEGQLRSNNNQLAPYSPAFDDIYFNPEDGIAESTHVFLEGNDLQERFKALKLEPNGNKKTFNIFETGFGTGLNFLLTAKLWQEIIAPDSEAVELHYWSVEQFPISPDDLKTIYQTLGLESDHSQALIQQYPDALPGIYTIEVGSGIKLHLVLSSLDKALKELALPTQFRFDAWFLDGFAPSKNPDMWAKGLLHFMALHSKPGTTVATFTVASALRKPLPHYGFEIEKRPGFGRKREMLTASFTKKELSPPKPTLADDYIKDFPLPQKVAIIGAGLAGCSLAHELQKQGIEAHLFEQHSTICSGASNMPSLVATPAMSIDHNAYSQLTFLGYEKLKRFIEQETVNNNTRVGHQLENQKYSLHHLKQYEETYSEQTWNRAEQLFKFDDINIAHDGGSEVTPLHCLKVPAIQVNGAEFCRLLTKAIPREQVHLSTKIDDMEKLRDFDHIVITSGHSSPTLMESLQLPQIGPLRGQLTTLNRSITHKTPVNHDGHIAHHKDQLVIGATFEKSTDDKINRESSLYNIEQANKRFGFNFSEKDIVAEDAGIRATTYDRFPFCGHYKSLDNAELWLNYGFGARGLCFALLCAEVTASAMLGRPSPLPKTLLSRISPLRI